MRFPRDSRGVVFSIGDRVAYNRSGDVVEGIVVGITRSEVRIQPHPDFVRSDHVSRVRNFQGILVLDA
jgi:hypothetical protein